MDFPPRFPSVIQGFGRFAIAFATALSASVHAALPGPVEALLEKAAVPSSAVGIAVLRASDGAVLYSHNAAVALQPASALKTLTAIAALDRLGPAYRAKVELRGPKANAGGVVAGHVALVGMGSVDFNAEAFQRMLAGWRQRGARELQGDLIIDREWFQPARGDLGLPPFDETTEFQYNVVPDALLLNQNLLRIDLVSNESGVSARMTPPLEGVTVRTDFRLIDGRCTDWEDGWTYPEVRRHGNGLDDDAATTLEIRLHGTFPKNCTASTEINVLDRADFADRLFRATWRSLGGEFQGRVRERLPGEPAIEGSLLGSHQGRTLGEITRDILKRSDNPVTRITFLHLGKLVPAQPGLTTAQLAGGVVRDWLAAKGIDAAGLVLENGSGLSRTERISAMTLARTLQVALKSPWAPEFLAGIPIVGVDGGMKNRLASTAAKDWGRFKTGTLRNTTALAGITPSRNGETRIVVAIVNHDNATSRVARPIADAIVDAMLGELPSAVAPVAGVPAAASR